MENEFFNVCGGRGGGDCKWVHTPGSLICAAGSPPTCNVVNLLEAEESDFHDCNLAEATRAINEILAKIPADSHGRNLSLIHTKMGQMLAWVNHGGTPTEGAVTADDDDETVAVALKLKM